MICTLLREFIAITTPSLFRITRVMTAERRRMVHRKESGGRGEVLQETHVTKTACRIHPANKEVRKRQADMLDGAIIHVKNET